MIILLVSATFCIFTGPLGDSILCGGIFHVALYIHAGTHALFVSIDNMSNGVIVGMCLPAIALVIQLQHLIIVNNIELLGLWYLAIFQILWPLLLTFVHSGWCVFRLSPFANYNIWACLFYNILDLFKPTLLKAIWFELVFPLIILLRTFLAYLNWWAVDPICKSLHLLLEAIVLWHCHITTILTVYYVSLL